ncbi:MAG: hypothetical protein AAF639_00660 [Chloroflexota bacterium]
MSEHTVRYSTASLMLLGSLSMGMIYFYPKAAAISFFFSFACTFTALIILSYWHSQKNPSTGKRLLLFVIAGIPLLATLTAYLWYSFA